MKGTTALNPFIVIALIGMGVSFLSSQNRFSQQENTIRLFCYLFFGSLTIVVVVALVTR
ncbi:MAG: hypothetical protein QNJ51_30605 [Calothrix sp. MO_167.B12]|nr:hypothetical protein [Calothrix sp. MO_167.B12]